MSKEVITLCIGGCGVKLGDSVWNQYNVEHCISAEGKHTDDDKEEDTTFENFYDESKWGKYIARTLMIDSNRNALVNIQQSKYNAIYDAQCFLSHNFDAENNFATGKYIIGKEMLPRITAKLNKMIESCDSFKGFIIKHAWGGGTGSGLGSLLFQTMADNYKKAPKVAFEVTPTPTISTCIVEPYNALLSYYNSTQYLSMSVNMDNEAIYEISQRFLDRRRPTFNDLNGLMRKPISSITSSLRFDHDGNFKSCDDFNRYLVPIPRLHHMITSYAPIMTAKKRDKINTDWNSLADTTLSPRYFLTKLDDFDNEEDKYMGVAMNFHGEIEREEADKCMKVMLTAKESDHQQKGRWGYYSYNSYPKIHYAKIVEDFNIRKTTSIFDKPIAKVDTDNIAYCKRNVCMLGNNTAIPRTFEYRVCRKYDLMYSQKAFVHWYVNEGMEEKEFEEAREDLKNLEKDYLDVLCAGEEDDEEEQDNE